MDHQKEKRSKWFETYRKLKKLYFLAFSFTELLSCRVHQKIELVVEYFWDMHNSPSVAKFDSKNDWWNQSKNTSLSGTFISMYWVLIYCWLKFDLWKTPFKWTGPLEGLKVDHDLGWFTQKSFTEHCKHNFPSHITSRACYYQSNYPWTHTPYAMHTILCYPSFDGPMTMDLDSYAWHDPI